MAESQAFCFVAKDEIEIGNATYLLIVVWVTTIVLTADKFVSESPQCNLRVVPSTNAVYG